MIMYKGLNMISCGAENCYIIKGKKGDVLIDTGSQMHRGRLSGFIKNFDIRLIILTHGHNDHVGNAAYFSEAFGAPVMISPYDLRLARDNLCRPHYALTAAGRFMRRENERMMKMPAERFDPRIFACYDMELSDYGIDGRIINLEGHTKGSVGVLCRGEMGTDLYAGDALMNIPIPCLPMIAESPKEAVKTAAAIADMMPDRILCGHGRPICKGREEYSRFIKRFSNK